MKKHNENLFQQANLESDLTESVVVTAYKWKGSASDSVLMQDWGSYQGASDHERLSAYKQAVVVTYQNVSFIDLILPCSLTL